MTRLTIEALQADIGVTPDGSFGPLSKAALSQVFSNPSAAPISELQFQAAADRLGVPVGHIKGSRKIEAPRGPFDDSGRPTILYERHKFAGNTQPTHRFDGVYPNLSGGPYGPGGYGPYAGQWTKLASACALDPEAAFAACSWGAFQVMGENARALGYASPYVMAKSLVENEAAHLETYIRFIEMRHLQSALRACRHGDPASCRPFVQAYNGAGFRQFNYDTKFAEAI